MRLVPKGGGLIEDPVRFESVADERAEIGRGIIIVIMSGSVYGG